jgi:hypothetical protein
VGLVTYVAHLQLLICIEMQLRDCESFKVQTARSRRGVGVLMAGKSLY